MSNLNKDELKLIKNDFDKKFAELLRARGVLISNYRKKLEEKKIKEIQDKIKQSTK